MSLSAHEISTCHRHTDTAPPRLHDGAFGFTDLEQIPFRDSTLRDG